VWSAKLKSATRNVKRELFVYQSILRDSRTPKIAKIFLGMAIGYLCLPFDLIPDFIPILGHLDDVIIIPLLVYIAFRFIPDGLIQEHRNRYSEMASSLKQKNAAEQGAAANP
jgi:uncharacterized membrane protein YkvA (DUF1232 family)